MTKTLLNYPDRFLTATGEVIRKRKRLQVPLVKFPPIRAREVRVLR